MRTKRASESNCPRGYVVVPDRTACPWPRPAGAPELRWPLLEDAHQARSKQDHYAWSEAGAPDCETDGSQTAGASPDCPAYSPKGASTPPDRSGEGSNQPKSTAATHGCEATIDWRPAHQVFRPALTSIFFAEAIRRVCPRVACHMWRTRPR
jgi:hypothetical protein